jgi:hypothetical protein
LARALRGLLARTPAFVAVTGLHNMEVTSRREGGPLLAKPVAPVLKRLLRRYAECPELLPMAERIRANWEEAERIGKRIR